MVHILAKFRENTSMRFSVTVRKLNVTDKQTDRRTDRWTDRQTDRGRCNISRPGPSAPREIKIGILIFYMFQHLRGWYSCGCGLTLGGFHIWTSEDYRSNFCSGAENPYLNLNEYPIPIYHKISTTQSHISVT